MNYFVDYLIISLIFIFFASIFLFHHGIMFIIGFIFAIPTIKIHLSNSSLSISTPVIGFVCYELYTDLLHKNYNILISILIPFAIFSIISSLTVSNFINTHFLIRSRFQFILMMFITQGVSLSYFIFGNSSACNIRYICIYLLK